MKIPAKCDGCGCTVDLASDPVCRVWSRTRLCRWCLERRLAEGKPINFVPQPENHDPCHIVCPHCGCGRQATEPGDYDSGERDCPVCGRHFDLVVETVSYFSTRPLESGGGA